MKYEQPYGVSDPNASYINGNSTTGAMGSIPPAASIENPQREIVNLITDARLATPDNADLHQLAKSVQSMLLVSVDDVGTVNQLQVTMTPAPTAYYKYMMVICNIANSNSGPSTLNCNALGPKHIVHSDNTELAKGELKAGSITCFEYDGTYFQMVWSSAGVSPVTGGLPIFLQTPQDWYVNASTGDDAAFDGTSATVVGGTSHGPFKTIQKACDQVPLYNMNNYSQTIHVADGTYAPFSARKINGSGSCFIIGNAASPSNCNVVGTGKTAMSFASVQGQYLVRGFKVSSSGTPSGVDALMGVSVSGNLSQLYLGEMVFGQCVSSSIDVESGAFLANWIANCPWTIAGGASGWAPPYIGSFYCCLGAQMGYNALGGPAINITTPVTFAGAFAQAWSFGNLGVLHSSLTGAGNVTGPRFNVSNLSLIATGGGGANYFPGTIAGTISSATGGYYS